MGRPAAIYLPLPTCKNGHKRTAKNTRWRTIVLYGKYEYRTARCALCEAATQLRNYHYKQKLAQRRQTRLAGQQPLQIEAGGDG